MKRFARVLFGLFIIIIIFVVYEFWVYLNLIKRPHQSSCTILPEKYCKKGGIKKIPNRSQLLIFTLPVGTHIYSPWEGIVYLNHFYYSPYSEDLKEKRKIAAINMTPPLKIIEQHVLKKRSFLIINDNNIDWFIKNGQTIKKGEYLGIVKSLTPLFPNDKTNVAFIFSDYRGNDFDINPANFGQFFDLD